jgi:hypothetical protein
MRLCLVVTLGAALILSGCSARWFSVTDPGDLGRLNSQLEGKRATITLRDGRVSEVVDIELGTEESSWVNLWSGERVSVPAEDVSSVRARAPGRGFMKLLLHSGAAWYAIAQEMPLTVAVLTFGPPLWILTGPPTAFSDVNVYELEYVTPSIPDDTPGSAGH